MFETASLWISQRIGLLRSESTSGVTGCTVCGSRSRWLSGGVEASIGRAESEMAAANESCVHTVESRKETASDLCLFKNKLKS